jgi:starch-binding outer membrane protein, SusD/RagB family
MKNYLYIFRKKYFFSTVLLTLIFSSCSEDVLKETPLDFLAPENAYNTVAGIQQGISGLHYSVRDAWFNGDNQDQMAMLVGGCGTDIAFHGENPGGNIKLVNYKNEMTPENSIFTYFWERNYSLIQRANVLIDRIKVSDISIWTNDAQKNAYLAEALFFRAYAYRMLVSFYGDVPLVTEPTKSAKTDFVRAPKADIYKLMEEDLTFAVANLPVRGKEEAPGRITQGAAGHFLTELYITQSKHQQAVDAASKVIDTGGYSLMTQRFGSTRDVFGKGDVFLDIFAYGNHNLSTNKEAVWVIQIEPIITGGGQYPGDRAWGPAYFRLGNTPDGKTAFRGELYNGSYTGYSDTLGRPVAWIKPTNYTAYTIWRSDWKNDIRNAEHHIKRTFYFDNPASAFNKKKIDFSLYPKGTRDALKDTCQYIYPYFLKHSDPLHHFIEPNRSGGGWTHKDVYAVRLAETILLRAEAYIGLGKKDLAAADINAVRNRAKATPVDPSKVDLDYLLDERARELYAEEWRPITLRRMGKLLERTRKYNNNPVFPACNIQDNNVLFPIPQKQLDLNIDAKMEQNPGYAK